MLNTEYLRAEIQLSALSPPYRRETGSGHCGHKPWIIPMLQASPAAVAVLAWSHTFTLFSWDSLCLALDFNIWACHKRSFCHQERNWQLQGMAHLIQGLRTRLNTSVKGSSLMVMGAQTVCLDTVIQDQVDQPHPKCVLSESVRYNKAF